jgi:RNA-dependent RNA polymerase
MQVMRDGIRFAGRKYEFLCFSASQLRENKCYFFASEGDDVDEQLSATAIRNWMGDFSGLTSLAKYSARLGQAFSKTTPTIAIPLEDVEDIPDITSPDGRYTFTDGCGEISFDYAQAVANALEIAEVPSAFQVRFSTFFSFSFFIYLKLKLFWKDAIWTVQRSAGCE